MLFLSLQKTFKHLPKVKRIVAQSYLTLWDPMDYSPPGFSCPGTLHTKILEWTVIPFSWDLPKPGIKSRSPALQADSLPFEPPGKPPKVLQKESSPFLLFSHDHPRPCACWPLTWHLLTPLFSAKMFPTKWKKVIYWGFFPLYPTEPKEQ